MANNITIAVSPSALTRKLGENKQKLVVIRFYEKGQDISRDVYKNLADGYRTSSKVFFLDMAISEDIPQELAEYNLNKAELPTFFFIENGGTTQSIKKPEISLVGGKVDEYLKRVSKP
ncbi:unnamed protein product [Rhizoctonia solani]|uniref:Thioredoxin domain-containing protein n=1 Tax=Rhizoctonia solani TaxID=456999 RepID=A0A8H2X2Q8_9AGAM|nr:unnamed protein product [Rhizoctonia solani]CAE6441483.1 unnamed protein product [Rhizoctonia solani]